MDRFEVFQFGLSKDIDTGLRLYKRTNTLKGLSTTKLLETLQLPSGLEIYDGPSIYRFGIHEIENKTYIYTTCYDYGGIDRDNRNTFYASSIIYEAKELLIESTTLHKALNSYQAFSKILHESNDIKFEHVDPNFKVVKINKLTISKSQQKHLIYLSTNNTEPLLGLINELINGHNLKINSVFVTKNLKAIEKSSIIRKDTFKDAIEESIYIAPTSKEEFGNVNSSDVSTDELIEEKLKKNETIIDNYLEEDKTESKASEIKNNFLPTTIIFIFLIGLVLFTFSLIPSQSVKITQTSAGIDSSQMTLETETETDSETDSTKEVLEIIEDLSIQTKGESIEKKIPLAHDAFKETDEYINNNFYYKLASTKLIRKLESVINHSQSSIKSVQKGIKYKQKLINFNNLPRIKEALCAFNETGDVSIAFISTKELKWNEVGSRIIPKYDWETEVLQLTYNNEIDLHSFDLKNINNRGCQNIQIISQDKNLIILKVGHYKNLPSTRIEYSQIRKTSVIKIVFKK